MKKDIIFILFISVFLFGFDFIEDSSPKNENEQQNIKRVINMMESDFSQDSFISIKQILGFISSSSKTVKELRTSKNLIITYKAYLAKGILENARTMFDNWREKSKYYEAKNDIDVKYKQMIHMIKSIHKNENRAEGIRSMTILIKENSIRISNTVENALKHLESLKQKYVKQKNQALFGLAVNAIGFYFGMVDVDVVDKVLLGLNVISTVFNSAALIDSHRNIYEINRQISLVDFKLIETEKAIERLATIESKQ